MSKTVLGGLANALKARSAIPYVGKQLHLPWINPSGAEQQMRAMGDVGTLFSIVNRTSTSTAAVEWELWRKHASGDKEKRTKVTRHWALDVWDKPNAFMPQQEFVETFQQHVDLTGEGWWVIGRDERARSIPLNMWPVRPDRMAPVPDAEKFISHYEYTAPDGTKIRLELDEVVFIRMPNPLDVYRGMGPVQAILSNLDSAKYSSEWLRNFFVNGAEPGGIIEVERRLDDKEFDEMSDRWDEQHKGVSNAHRVAIIEQGKWVDRKFTNRDMQFAELQDVGSKVIREAFGIPKFAVGDVEDVNRATAEASKAWFAEALTVPRLDRIKSALNNDFLPLFGDGAKELEFDYVSPVPADREALGIELTAKSGAAKTFLEAGFEVKDVLKVCELPDMKWEKPEPPTIVAPPGADGEKVPPGGGGAPAKKKVAADELYEALRNVGWEGRPKGQAALTDEVNAAIQRAADRMLDLWHELLDRLIAAWNSITELQLDSLVDQVLDVVRYEYETALGDLQVPTDEASDLLADFMVEMADRAAADLVTEAAEQGVVVEPTVPGRADLAALAGVVTALLAAGLAASVGGFVLRVLTPQSEASAIAELVRAHVRGLSDRALRDQLGGALTNARNRARFASMLGQTGATWYAVERMDQNSCDPCEAIDDHAFDSVEDAFLAYPNGGYVDCKGGVRCRGGVVPIWPSVNGS